MTATDRAMCTEENDELARLREVIATAYRQLSNVDPGALVGLRWVRLATDTLRAEFAPEIDENEETTCS